MLGQSLWHATCPADVLFDPRHGDDGDLDVDVVIVGAGYTGLWTALSLLEAEPAMRVVVVERAHVGFGASGRNGGWCSALLPMSLDTIADAAGRDAAVRMQRAMFEAVEDVGATTVAEGIDCDLVTGGYVALARNRPQLDRLRARVETLARYGLADHLRLLDGRDARARVGAAGVIGGSFDPHCAALHPQRL